MLKCSICGKTYATARERASCELACAEALEKAALRQHIAEREATHKELCDAYAEFIRIRNKYKDTYGPVHIHLLKRSGGDSNLTITHPDAIYLFVLNQEWRGEPSIPSWVKAEPMVNKNGTVVSITD